MRRRHFIAGLFAGSAMATTSVAMTMGATKISHIGYLGTNTGPASLPPIEAFRQGLRRLGYVEGQNIIVEYRWGRGEADDLARQNAAELVGLDLNLIVAANSLYVLPLRQASGTIPIVFCVSGDPVAEGIVASLARPGGNTTGVSVAPVEFGGKELQLLAQAVPNVQRVAVLWDTTPSSRSVMPAVKAAAQKLSMQLRPVLVTSADEFDGAFEAIVSDKAQAVLLLGASLYYQNRARLAALALEHHLPSMWYSREGPEAGGLLSYGMDLNATMQHCAVYVDKVLKGTKPGDLPVEQAATFKLVINLKTAKALGLTIPPSLLAQADEVIE